jgi:prepilin-type N-terminal cleavage/methylation domain-containing protein/prepilin-type processing-associated H-X9-DG protein
METFMVRTPPRKRPGFTLIELLVVIAIIAVLIGLLLPGVQKVREAAARTQCTNNLKQMGLAMHNYHLNNQMFPSGYYQAGTLQQTGWQLQLLPYIEQMNVYNQSVTYLTANPGLGHTDSTAYPAVNFQCPTFICPSNLRATTFDNGGINYELTSYMGCTGTTSNSPSPGGALFYNSTVTIIQISDGTSNTIAIGERPCSGDLNIGWGFAPFGTGFGDGDTVLGSNDGYLALDFGDVATNVGFQAPSQPMGTAEIDAAHYWSFHTNGANFVFCDGSVHFLSYSANNVFPQMCTIAGGEFFASPF